MVRILRIFIRFSSRLKPNDASVSLIFFSRKSIGDQRNRKDSSDEDSPCSACNSKITSQEHDMVQRLRNAFLQTVEQTGMWDFHRHPDHYDLIISNFDFVFSNLRTVIPPKDVEEVDTSEYCNYSIKCDAKYLKKNAKGETPLHLAAKKVTKHVSFLA